MSLSEQPYSTPEAPVSVTTRHIARNGGRSAAWTGVVVRAGEGQFVADLLPDDESGQAAADAVRNSLEGEGGVSAALRLKFLEAIQRTTDPCNHRQVRNVATAIHALVPDEAVSLGRLLDQDGHDDTTRDLLYAHVIDVLQDAPSYDEARDARDRLEEALAAIDGNAPLERIDEFRSCASRRTAIERARTEAAARRVEAGQPTSVFDVIDVDRRIETLSGLAADGDRLLRERVEPVLSYYAALAVRVRAAYRGAAPERVDQSTPAFGF